MNTYKCPVCGSPGIPDYHKDNVVCPHCGSDLKIYRKVSELANVHAESNEGTKKYKILSFILPVIAVAISVAACMVFYSRPEDNFHSQYIKSEKLVSQLKDSVSVLKAQVQKATETKENRVDYIVVKNDGPWIIVNKLYGNRKDWESIAKSIAIDNNIWDDTQNTWKQIYPGQILKINLIK